MADRTNVAHRLERVLEKASQQSGERVTFEIWAEVFDILESDPRVTATKVVHMLSLLRDQANEVRRKMQDTTVRAQQYEPALDRVLNALDILSLSATWNSYKPHLDGNVLSAIGWCADSLPFEEDVIDPDDLYRFEEEVKQFATDIASGDMPDYVKSFTLQQVGIIEQAIREYPIIGARAFKRGYANSFVNLTEHQETFIERQDEEEMQDLRGFWSQMQRYAQKAGPWVAIGQAAVKGFELMGGV